MNTLPILLEKIKNAKKLDFGDIISDTIELFKKVWIKGLVLVLLIIVSAVCFGFLFGLIGLAPKIDPAIFMKNFNLESFISFYRSNIIYGIPQNILISTLTIAFLAAFYRICNQTLLENEGNDDYFYFLNKTHFSKVFMLGIIFTAIATAAQLLFFIPYIYVYIPLSFVSVILADNPNLSEMEIVKASFALGNKKWLLTFGTLFVAGLMGMLGILGCGIGIILTISILYLPVFLIYRESIGFGITEEEHNDRISY